MKSIGISIVVDGIQQTFNVGLIERDGNYFVANPRADIPLQPSLVQLDPKRLVKQPDVDSAYDYMGVLLEIRTLPEGLA